MTDRDSRERFSDAMYCLQWHQLTGGQQMLVDAAIKASRPTPSMVLCEEQEKQIATIIMQEIVKQTGGHSITFPWASPRGDTGVCTNCEDGDDINTGAIARAIISHMKAKG